MARNILPQDSRLARNRLSRYAMPSSSKYSVSQRQTRLSTAP